MPCKDNDYYLGIFIFKYEEADNPLWILVCGCPAVHESMVNCYSANAVISFLYFKWLSFYLGL